MDAPSHREADAADRAKPRRISAAIAQRQAQLGLAPAGGPAAVARESESGGGAAAEPRARSPDNTDDLLVAALSTAAGTRRLTQKALLRAGFEEWGYCIAPNG
jgi:hypothetical protein